VSTELEKADEQLNTLLTIRNDIAGDIDILALKVLAMKLLELYPSATHVDLEDGDQSEYDVVIAGICVKGDGIGLKGGDSVIDLEEDDDIADVVMQLLSYRLNERPFIEQIGTRRNGRWRLDLAAAAALQRPAGILT
jgi:hypothetical protein